MMPGMIVQNGLAIMKDSRRQEIKAMHIFAVASSWQIGLVDLE